MYLEFYRQPMAVRAVLRTDAALGPEIRQALHARGLDQLAAYRSAAPDAIYRVADLLTAKGCMIHAATDQCREQIENQIRTVCLAIKEEVVASCT